LVPRRLFMCGDSLVFQGGFADLGAQNVVFCVVVVDKIVVKTW
jgi:hypothetical protein